MLYHKSQLAIATDQNINKYKFIVWINITKNRI